MRHWRWQVGITVLLLLVGWSARAAEVAVVEAALAAGVENRQPVGAATVFSANVGRVYAYTRLAGAAAEGAVTHVWYYAGEVKAQVKLTVGADDWRTWSSKTILPQWTGEWLVEVQGADGRVLASLSFRIE